MHNQGLVQRLGHGTYRITAAGRAAEPVHRALADWHRQNLTTDTADAERAEDVLARLHPAGTTATLAALDRHGRLTYPEVVESTGLHPSSAYQRLARLERDGLILRGSPGRGARYWVSPAAEQLGNYLQERSRSASHITPVKPPAPTPLDIQRTAAARSRSTVARTVLPAPALVYPTTTAPPATASTRRR
ncbi:helix-turn-helix transcriptional regulator [Streptomyces sp. NPDC003860]